jgi:hypothetical protein
MDKFKTQLIQFHKFEKSVEMHAFQSGNISST